MLQLPLTQQHYHYHCHLSDFRYKKMLPNHSSFAYMFYVRNLKVQCRARCSYASAVVHSSTHNTEHYMADIWPTLWPTFGRHLADIFGRLADSIIGRTVGRVADFFWPTIVGLGHQFIFRLQSFKHEVIILTSEKFLLNHSD